MTRVFETSADGAATIRVLGPVEAVVGGRRVALSALESALVAVLAARVGRTVSVDHLISVLWDDPAPRSARNRVHALVSSIRRATAGAPHALIETSPPGYRLRRGTGVLDVVGFDHHVGQARRLARLGRPADAVHSFRLALGLWRGTPFYGLDGLRDADVHAELARLQETRSTAVEECFDAELALGRQAALIPELSALVAAHPLRERLRAQLMLALHRVGRPADAAAVYRDGYDILTTQLGNEPGPELQSMHQIVLGGRPPPAASPPTGPVRITALPVDPPDFTGRGVELGRIEAMLAEHAHDPVVFSISGLGGTGKTTLAVRAAHAVGAGYSDGCYFFDMRGAGTLARRPPEVMASILHSIGLSFDAIPDDADALATVFRSAVAARRILLVLDDVADEAQVRPLLAHTAGSAIITTSRRALVGLDAALQMPLDAMPVSEATALLERIIGTGRVETERNRAERIVDHCSRLPLAVRIVGVRIALQPEISLARMADRLAELTGRLDQLTAGDREVRASLDIAYARLDPRAALVLRSACLLPSPELPAWAIAAAAGTMITETESSLARLVEVSLVSAVYDTGGARYRIHDLVRSYGRDRAAQDGPGVREAGLRRAYEGLTGLALRANAALPSANLPLPPPVADWYAAPRPAVDRAGGPGEWFHIEHSLVVGVVRECLRRHWLDLAWRLVAAMTVNVGNRGTVDEWFALANDVLIELRGDATDPLGRATLALAVGGNLRGRGRTAQALPALREARLAYRRLGDDEPAAIAAAQLGMAARALQRFRVARACLNWAVSRLDAMTSAQHLAQTLIGLGNVHLDLGEQDRARAAYERALRVLAVQPNPSVEANALICLGTLAGRQQRYGDAADHYDRALTLLAHAGDRANTGRVELGLAETHLGMGRLGRAAEFADRAIGTLLDVGDAIGHAMALAVRGRVLLHGGDATEAIATLTEAARGLERAGNQLSRANTLLQLGEAYEAIGEPEQARRAFSTAKEIHAALGN